MCNNTNEMKSNINFVKDTTIANKTEYKESSSKILIFLMICIFLTCITLFTLTIESIYKKAKNHIVSNSTSISSMQGNETITDETTNSNTSAHDNNNESIENYNVQVNNPYEVKSSVKYDSIDNSNTKEVLSGALDTLSSCDFKEFNNYINKKSPKFDNIYSIISEEDASIVKYSEFFKHALTYNYEVESINEDNNSAVAKVKIQTYDYTYTVMDARLHISDSQIASQFSGNNKSKDEIAMDELNKIFSKMTYSIEKNTEIKLIKENDSWKLDQSDIDENLYESLIDNLYQSIVYYNDFYKQPDLNNISLDAFKEFVEKNK